MADIEQVKLHSSWESPFGFRVIWALKLKGIPFEYIEEDLDNKSKLLLQYNPIHKKVPVLVHGGKPICESLVIIEYIEETWPQNPLLPNDPYHKAQARFWANYADDKVAAIVTVLTSRGEEQEKGKKEILEMLRIMEEQALVGGKKFFAGEKIGIADIAFGWMSLWLKVIEEVVGFKLLEAHAYPHVHAWINNFKQVPVIKQNLPDSHKMLVFFKGYREKLLASSSS